MTLRQSSILWPSNRTASALVALAVLSLVAACGGKGDDADDSSAGGDDGNNAGRGGASTQGGSGGAQAGNSGNGAGGKAGSGGGNSQGGTGPRAGDGGMVGGGGEGDGGTTPTAGMGGSGTASGTGGEGDAGGGNSQGGSAGAPDCGTGEVQTQRKHAQRGRSDGYSGTSEDYYALWDETCVTFADCLEPCMAAGGTQDMCSLAECADSDVDYCYPPPYWYVTESLYEEGTDPYSGGAELVLVASAYHDYLLFDDFQLEVPANAQIVGITATLRRTADGENVAVDRSVRLIKGGDIGAGERVRAEPWNVLAFTNVDYGGPSDLWDTTWTPADVNAADFGLALSLDYRLEGGNARAYVDIAFVTVSYQSCP